MIVATFTTLVGLVACYGDFYLGYLGHLVWYDDGVYMAAAIQLSHGIVPYRDFVLLHPPGIALLLTPFALIGRSMGTAVANEAARLFVVVVAMASVVLFGRVVRMRPVLAVAVGLLLFALHRDTLIANQVIYLEPLLVAVCLVGTVLVFDGEGFAARRWRWWAGGAVFGLASAIKIWGFMPMFAVVVVAVLMRRRADAGRFVVAGAGAFALVCAPFFALAPMAFVRDVFLDQASRSDPFSVAASGRVGNLLYLPPSLANKPAVVDAIVVVVVGVIVWLLVRTRQQSLSALEWYSMVSAVLVMGAFLVSADYYMHYGAFAAVFFGFVGSAMISRLLVVRGGTRGARELPNIRKRHIVTVTAVILVAVVLLVGSGMRTLQDKTSGLTVSSRLMARLATVIPPGRCVVSDDISILLLSGRFTADVRGCPSVIDEWGTEQALTDGHYTRAAETAAVQREWLNWIERAHDLVLNDRNLSTAAESDYWSQRLVKYVRTHFSLVSRTGTVLIYQRVHGESSPANS
ncbi:MAG: glycosyltransferase family 87 protein [Acidimicrobiales bacterium]